jgi:two-component sensor histidine kinase
MARKLLDLRLPADPVAPSMARHAISKVLAASREETVHAVGLIITELISNSVRHARFLGNQGPHVAVWRLDGHLRVEVQDSGPCFESRELKAPAKDAAGSWGLYLVDKLAERWGVQRGSNECTVWAEVEAPVSSEEPVDQDQSRIDSPA